jgi:DNA polymerase (family 10)
MDKWAVSRVLGDIAAYLELKEPNRFKALAFERAARAIEKIDVDIEELIDSGKLYDTPGIGKAIGPIITELVTTGQSRYLEELRQQYPAGIFDLLRVRGLGLKKIGLLYNELGIASVKELEEAATSGRLRTLKGFGPGTEKKILEGIAFAEKQTSRFLLPVGLEVGELIRERLAAIDEIVDAEVAGSVRRRMEVIRNVNIVLATTEQELVVKRLEKIVNDLEPAGEGVWKGVARNEIDVLFHLTSPDRYGAAMVRATGSADFLTAFQDRLGRDLDTLKARTEQDAFRRAGVPWVEPELREDAALLAKMKRVKLVAHNDIRGTFHVHTTWSDGRNSVEEMLSAARDRGFEYVGISDHSKAAYYAGGLSEQTLVQQQAEIDAHRKGVAPMRVFKGTEADILQDGSIDYGPEILPMFDFVIASVHSNFKTPKDEMTERILKALDDPHVTFLGHLTGRLLLSREGYSVDYDRIFERAAARGVIIEINGNPRRLDVDWRYLGRAVDRGAIFSINPDAHSIRELTHIVSGTWVARKAGLTAKHIFNTRPVDEVEEWMKKRKASAKQKTGATRG